jgi:hypothetical protein
MSAVSVWAAAYTCQIFPYDQVVPSGSTFITYPTGLNDSSQTVGSYQTCANGKCIHHGLLRAADGTITSIVYPNSVGTTARSINNQGQITGGYTDANGLQHGYIRQANGAFTKMDAPAQFAGKAAEGWGISNNGDVLGVFLGPLLERCRLILIHQRHEWELYDLSVAGQRFLWLSAHRRY